MLANRHVMASLRTASPAGRSASATWTSYRPGDGTATRALAMAAARSPRAAARDVPAGLDLVHYPVTVPIPATARAARRHAARRPAPRPAGAVLARRARLPALGLRPSRARRRRGRDVERVPDGRIVDAARASPRARRGRSPRDRPRALHARAARRRRARARRRSACPSGSSLYPANLWPHKNHERLLEALALLRDRELRLVLTGQDYGRLDGLLRRARRAGRREPRRHLGHVPAETAPGALPARRALVFPSLYEGFGAPPLEAMACGCPVAASDARLAARGLRRRGAALRPAVVESIAAAIDRVTLRRRSCEGDCGRRSGARARVHVAAVGRAAPRKIYARAAATWPTCSAS